MSLSRLKRNPSKTRSDDAVRLALTLLTRALKKILRLLLRLRRQP